MFSVAMRSVYGLLIFPRFSEKHKKQNIAKSNPFSILSRFLSSHPRSFSYKISMFNKTTRPFSSFITNSSLIPPISKNSRVLVIGQEIIQEGGWGKAKTESSPFRSHMWTHIFYDILEMKTFLCFGRFFVAFVPCCCWWWWWCCALAHTLARVYTNLWRNPSRAYVHDLLIHSLAPALNACLAFLLR